MPLNLYKGEASRAGEKKIGLEINLRSKSWIMEKKLHFTTM